MNEFRVAAIVACLIGVIFFIVAVAATPGAGQIVSLKDVCFGLVALTVAVGCLAAEGVRRV
jgi:hypothetical protein